ncbi:ArnT family glycosyltransferase [Methylopila jiangsuensis]
MDRDEPRFAQASRQMLERGDFVDIRLQQEARHNKPAGVYWLQAASVATADALGVPDAERTIGLYRLPSFLGMLAAVLATYWAGLAIMDRRGALAGAAGFAATLIAAVEARLATTDAALLATATLAFGALIRIYLATLARRAPPLGVTLLFWVAVGAGVLIKGPIVPLIAGFAIAALCLADRSLALLKRLNAALGLAIVAAMAAPWLIMIGLKSGGGFFVDSLGKDLLLKAAGPQESHGAPPGAFFVAAWGTFWPLAPYFAVAAPGLWAARREPWAKVILAWAVPAWIMFELVPTKLPHYVMPLYPALALAVGWTAADGRMAIGRRWAKALILLVPFGPLALTIGFSWLIWRLDGGANLPFLIAGALAFALAAAAVPPFWRGRALVSLVAAFAASAVMTAAVFGLAARDLDALFPMKRLADTLPALGCAEPLAAVAGFREPSLILLTRTDLILTDGAGAARFLKQGGCRAAFVERRQQAAFDSALTTEGVTPRRVAEVSGVAINGAKHVSYVVYGVAP